ncbi:MAG: DMT family transporter, partial [Pseudomonadota bacterium]|nr:DMT family transporter [Pseudomonadota bacterium]
MNTPEHRIGSPYLLLGALILAWALAWPLSKIGLAFSTPVWYATFRSAIGTLFVFAYLLGSRKLHTPRIIDIPQIFSIGIFQMGVFLMLIYYGLSFVEPGRSAILAYTTPLWVTPIAYFIFKEELTPLKAIGFFLGLSGILILFSPWSFDWHDHDVLIGHASLLTAAIVWAGVIIYTRHGKWHAKPIDLLPWQLLLSTVFTAICALIFEPLPADLTSTTLWATLLYNGVFASAFGYFASVSLAKSLPMVTTSIGFLGVPVFGLLFSSIMVQEKITLNLIIAG